MNAKGLLAMLIMACAAATAPGQEAEEVERQAQAAAEARAREAERSREVEFREAELRAREAAQRERAIALEAAERDRRLVLDDAQRARREALQAVAQQREAEVDLREVERKMREAQARLERVAQEIATLSAQRVAPRVGRNVVIAPELDGVFALRRRPTLGIVIEDADDGVLVTGVTPNGPADNAGVQTGDVITAISGESVDSRDDGDDPSEWLLEVLGRSDPGDTVSLVVTRAGEPISVEIETDENQSGGVVFRDRQDHFTLPRFDDFDWSGFNVFGSRRWHDMELVELSPGLGEYFGTEEGLLIVSAPQDESLGLLDGDVILRIGSRTPSSVEHAMRILASFEPGETLTLTVMRQQRRRDVEIELE